MYQNNDSFLEILLILTQKQHIKQYAVVCLVIDTVMNNLENVVVGFLLWDRLMVRFGRTRSPIKTDS